MPFRALVRWWRGLGGSCIGVGDQYPLAVGAAFDAALFGEDGKVLANVAGMKVGELGELGDAGRVVLT